MHFNSVKLESDRQFPTQSMVTYEIKKQPEGRFFCFYAKCISNLSSERRHFNSLAPFQYLPARLPAWLSAHNGLIPCHLCQLKI